MSLKKYLLSITVTLLFTSSLCFADSVPLSQCANYLSYSDSQFNSLAASNKNAASNIASVLNSCAV
ncbi:hypothetical protein [Candidatus Coxiella mudrowiae]|uniref:hypothetical protein n=1 Tax=Candidatus Coxiella mudrowiae TaxID=2054173 RepID=UPI00066216E7|nr:hypothetical protein [Candidatus Coxiella mudrowiae]